MGTWYWEFQRDSSVSMGESTRFESRGDAESWLGLNFTDLLERGIDEVVLHDGDATVGDAMSLHP
jgi:hypothetical protein